MYSCDCPNHLVEPTRAEAGCLSYKLLQDQVRPNEFIFSEEWKSKAALLLHLDSGHAEEAFLEGESFLERPPDIRKYYPIGQGRAGKVGQVRSRKSSL
ncbi:MAG TPA: putative quinol monooxygenase [Coleofasciculaceae cyanobacterium]